MEVWRDIADFEGAYQVSSCGRVRSIDRMVQTKKGLRKKRGQLLSCTDNGKGYLYVTLGRGKKVGVHRLVALAFLIPVVGKTDVNHKDGDKGNNHYLNLEWATPSENQYHAKATGLAKVGEQHVQSKFTNDEVKFIRENYVPRHAEFGMGGLSRRFKVSTATIHRIVHGTRRRHG